MFSSILSNFAFIMMNISSKRYLQGLGVTVILLAVLRCAYPEVASSPVNEVVAADSYTTADSMAVADSAKVILASSSAAISKKNVASVPVSSPKPLGRPSRFFAADGTPVKNRIYSVPHFGNTFPDQNDVQLVAATRYGVKAVIDRADAERRKSELVYVGSNPFYHIDDRMRSSIPYLVPRAAILLQDIGRSFFDSLQTKQIPLHKVIVTSVLRSKADVAKLRQRNSNATENSCHLYGTTFDICYNRYRTVEDPDGPHRRQVRNDSLKWVLSEVLRDMREQKRCLVKYEVKQGCFHITVN